MCIGTAVQADQQNVDRAVVAALTQRGREHVEDAIFERPNVVPRDPGADNDRDGQGSGNRTNHTLHRHHIRLLATHPLSG